MSLIGTPVKPFTAQAFKQGKFVTVSDADLMLSPRMTGSTGR